MIWMGGIFLERSIGKLSCMLTASIWRDYRQTVLGKSVAYIHTAPIQNLLRIMYLSMIQLLALLITYTNLKYFALFFEIYYAFGFYCCLVIWQKNGYSKWAYVALTITAVLFEIWLIF